MIIIDFIIVHFFLKIIFISCQNTLIFFNFLDVIFSMLLIDFVSQLLLVLKFPLHFLFKNHSKFSQISTVYSNLLFYKYNVKINKKYSSNKMFLIYFK